MAEFIDIVAVQRDDDPIEVFVYDDHGELLFTLDQDGAINKMLLADVAGDRFDDAGRSHRIRIQHDDVQAL